MAASALALAALRFPLHQAGPQPAHTGGFGEPTCHACHFDYPLNQEPRAVIRLDSLPAQFRAGRMYRLQLSVQHSELKRGGFQLSARFDDGSAAGTFVIADTNQVRVQQAGGIDYLSHTSASSDRAAGDMIAWVIDWVAPAASRRVVFHVAANVANADASEFGDRIFSAAFYSDPTASDGK
ncbi:MAG TPA: choice-of-anchor V domain-containing protein [Longimicrobiales bacterium]